MNRAKYIILLLALPLLMFQGARVNDVIHFTREGLDLFNVTVSTDNRGGEVYSLVDTTYAGNDVPHITDLALSFNRDSENLIKDDTGQYRVRHSSYLHVKKDGVIGGGGARFFRSEDRVELETDRNLWMTECGDLGSFTIEFRVRPSAFGGTKVIFSRVGMLSGVKNGIEIALINRRLSARFYGIFRNSQGRRVDVHLNRGNDLRENRWYHFMLSYDRLSGKIARYINGGEEEVAYVTENREPYVGVYQPSFHCDDRPIAVIGGDFFGTVDEFRITHRHYPDLKKETALAYSRYKKVGGHGRKPVNREGVITSPVYTLPLTGTQVMNFSWLEAAVRETFVWMEFRISDTLFYPGDASPRWYRIRNNQRNIYLKKTENGDYLRGKFYQWRAHLAASPDGARSPRLSAIEMNYRLDTPPRAPAGLEALSAGDGKVTLRWRKNLEDDVLGYRVYYGIRPRSYDGKITFIRGKRIPESARMKGGYIEVDIDNAVIEENRKLDGLRVLSYPVLKNTILYYFSVSAYDGYKPDTVHNHESEPSAGVTARPYAGSEIDP